MHSNTAMSSQLRSIDPDANHYNGMLGMNNSSITTKYCSLEGFKNGLSRRTPSINILHWNIRSFRNNVHALHSMFEAYKFNPDVLVLSESWFRVNTTGNLEGFHAYHTPRAGGRAGSCSVFNKERWVSSCVVYLRISNSSIEICIVRVEFGDDTIFVLGVYRRHPDTFH